MTDAPSPGWYPDPDGSGRPRYWSGSAWGPLELDAELRQTPAEATEAEIRAWVVHQRATGKNSAPSKPGWYPDLQRPGVRRRWNGTTWAEDRIEQADLPPGGGQGTSRRPTKAVVIVSAVAVVIVVGVIVGSGGHAGSSSSAVGSGDAVATTTVPVGFSYADDACSEMVDVYQQVQAQSIDLNGLSKALGKVEQNAETAASYNPAAYQPLSASAQQAVDDGVAGDVTDFKTAIGALDNECVPILTAAGQGPTSPSSRSYP